MVINQVNIYPFDRVTLLVHYLSTEGVLVALYLVGSFSAVCVLLLDNEYHFVGIGQIFAVYGFDGRHFPLRSVVAGSLKCMLIIRRPGFIRNCDIKVIQSILGCQCIGCYTVLIGLDIVIQISTLVVRNMHIHPFYWVTLLVHYLRAVSVFVAEDFLCSFSAAGCCCYGDGSFIFC